MPIISSRSSGSARGFGFGMGAAGPIASGGDLIATYNGYTYHVFLNSGTFTALSSKAVNVLSIGGGGGGGGHHSTLYTTYGGGAGALSLQNTNVTAGTYAITVGDGGSGGSSGTRGANGSSSQFGSLTAATGGGGGGSSTGGGTYYNSSPVDGSTGQNGGNGGGGNPAGSGSQGYSGSTAGGGGAGGAASSNAPGDGALYSDWIIASGLDTEGRLAGGGGSSDYINVNGGGGKGGGPAPWGPGGTSGLANTGGGGGASGKNQDFFTSGGAGGKGVVIVRYQGSHPDAVIRTAPGTLPSNTSAPSISGTYSQGGTISKTSDGSWSESPTSYEYKWQYSNDGSLWGDRTSWSATYSDYTIDSNASSQAPWQYYTSYPRKDSTSYTYPQYLNGSKDQGLYFRLAVRAINASGKSSPAYSAQTTQIPAIPIYSGGSSWVGSLSSGSTGYGSLGSWSYNSPQWLYMYARSSNGASSGITAFMQTGSTDGSGNTTPGWANGRNYTITASDRGSYLMLILTPIQGSTQGGSGVYTNLGYVP